MSAGTRNQIKLSSDLMFFIRFLKTSPTDWDGSLLGNYGPLREQLWRDIAFVRVNSSSELAMHPAADCWKRECGDQKFSLQGVLQRIVQRKIREIGKH